MATELLSLIFGAGETRTIGQGRILVVKSATAAVSIRLERSQNASAPVVFSNIPAGFKYKAEQGWITGRITSAVAQTVEVIVGDDDVEFASAVSVTGTASFAEAPSSAITATADDVSVAAAGNSAIAANTNRRRITIQAISTNTGSLRVSTSTTVGRGLELQPGVPVELKTTAALYVTNGTGAAQSFTVCEEI